MAVPPMDPQYEQRLRDEVIYLHSLWHQGPPRPATSAAVVRHHLQPSKSAHFKKDKRQRRRRRSKFGKNPTNNPSTSAHESNSSPGVDWPCPSPPPSTSGWPTFASKANPQPAPLSPDEQSKLGAKNVHHHHALKVVREFFMSNNPDDSDAINSSSDEDDELMEKDYGREEYSFFFKVFKEDNDLREYYEKNFAKGDFNCLVCGAVGGKKTGKKFKGCLPLVQHAITIAKTKKRRAHRAFGQAVCKILGWDIDHLSAIVSMLSDRSDEIQGNEEAAPETGRIGSRILPNVDEGDMNSLTYPDADKNLENSGAAHAYNVEALASDGLTIGNGDGDNKESSMTCVDNVDSIKNDTLEGRNEEAAQETGHIESGISPNVDEGDMNSLMCVDTDKNLQNLGMVYQHSMVGHASQGSTINSLGCPDADSNEEFGILYQHNVKQHEPEGLMNVPLTGKNHGGYEKQDLQMP